MNPWQLAFTADEFEQRLGRLRRRMSDRGVDIVIVDEVEHIGYLTGYVPTAATYQSCVVPTEGSPVMIVRALDEPTFVEQCWVRDYVTFADWEDPVGVLIATIRSRGWGSKRIGQELDSHFLLVQRFQAIQAGLADATFVDFSRELWELRLRKSPQEIVYLRQAARIADIGMSTAVATAGAGQSERAVAAAISSRALIEGADNTRLALVVAGNRTGALHGSLSGHILEVGDLMHVELAPQVRGYSSRVMRPTVVGDPVAELAATALQLVQIQDEQLEAMKPGAVASEIDRICRTGVLAAGLRNDYPNTTGYTLGYIAIPRTSDFTRTFTPISEWVLEEDMVFHMYTFARGISFSETILITQKGHERLTRVERRLFSAGER